MREKDTWLLRSLSLVPVVLLLQVRLEWLRCVGDWMLNLRERVDHEPRLLPYALSALCDDSPQVS
jgi:hypothetical protein